MDNDIERFNLELRKFELEEFTRKKELELKERELNKKNITVPLLVAIVAGVIGLLTNILTTYLSNEANINLEEHKLRSNLILKAVEGSDPEQAKNNILFFNEVGFLPLPDSVTKKIKENKLPLPQINGIEDKGLALFKQNCASCHGLKKPMAAKSMTDVMKNIPGRDWFKKWFGNPNPNSTMLDEFSIKMRTHQPANISECDAEELFDYLLSATN